MRGSASTETSAAQAWGASSTASRSVVNSSKPQGCEPGDSYYNAGTARNGAHGPLGAQLRKSSLQRTGWTRAAGTTVPRGIVGELPTRIYFQPSATIPRTSKTFPRARGDLSPIVLAGKLHSLECPACSGGI